MMDQVLTTVGEWAIRSTLLAGAVGVVLAVFRVKDVSMKLACWTAVLYGMLLAPLLFVAPPAVTVPAPRVAASPSARPIVVTFSTTAPSKPTPPPINWTAVAFSIYASGAITLLIRLLIGTTLMARLARQSRPVDIGLAGIAVRECAALSTPVTMGVFRPVILLPTDWPNWEDTKMRAVIAHEMSHVRRRDPLTQMLASLLRALQWFNPLTWWLRKNVTNLAELASDDHALSVTQDRTGYAEILLGFFQRAPKRVRWEGVAMARGLKAGQRIDRILSDSPLSRGLSRMATATIALAVVPLLYVVATAQPLAPAPPEPPPAAAGEPAPPEPPQRGSHHDEEWAVFTGDTTTSHGSTSQLRRLSRLKSKYGDHFIWFERGDKEYVIRDRALVDRARELWKPQEELGRKQAELGEKQAELGAQQAKIGERQASVRTKLPDLTRELRDIEKQMKNLSPTNEELGQLQAMLGDLQARIGDAQSHIGDAQAKLGDEQAVLGDKQAKLGDEQAKLGDQQAKLSEQADRQMQKLLDEAIAKKLAEPLP